MFDRDLVLETLGPGARVSLDEMQILPPAAKIDLRAEVRYVNDERVALPTAARVAVPLADAGRQMRPPIHDDIALQSLPLAHVVVHRDAARSLDDAPEAAAGPVAEFEEPKSQTAVRERSVLGTV